MAISPLAPDQTIAQMWTSGARWLEMSLFLILSPSPIWAPLQLSRERQPNRQQTTRLQSISDLKRHIFFPVAIETAGSWSQQAIELVLLIGGCTTVITEASREKPPSCGGCFKDCPRLCRGEMRSHFQALSRKISQSMQSFTSFINIVNVLVGAKNNNNNNNNTTICRAT